MKFKRGFTLLELLVVISIIGILASIVLTSLVVVRNKAKNAVIKAEADELLKLLELEYAETGSYANLQKDVLIPSEGDCDLAVSSGGFAGNFRDEVIVLCQKILSLAPDLGGNKFLMANSVDLAGKYSIMVTLWNMSGAPNFYCVGSSGKYEGESFPFDHPNQAVGCYWNP